MIVKAAFVFFILLVVVSGLMLPTKVYGAVPCQSITSYKTIPEKIGEGIISIEVEFSTLDPGWYRLRFPAGTTTSVENKGGPVKIPVDRNLNRLSRGEHVSTLMRSDQQNGSYQEFCGDVKYKVGFDAKDCKLTYNPVTPTAQEEVGIRVNDGPTGTYFIGFTGKDDPLRIQKIIGSILIDNFGKGSTTIPSFKSPAAGDLSVISGVSIGDKAVSLNSSDQAVFCTTPIVITISGKNTPRPVQLPPVNQKGLGGTATLEKCELNDPKCSSSRGVACDPKNGRVYDYSDYVDKARAKEAGGVMTAIGCVPTEPNTLIAGLMRVATAAGGGIAFLLMIFGSLRMITSAGNPENLKKGQEQFVSAVVGLLFIIFSTLLMQIIGVDILAIPGFTR